ncbi:MAG: serine/threonine-protein phosphatase [Actinomycetales bacterium]|nr:serine/threonine-protein phosphatase [Actinomycetales bacterium]
MAIALRYAARSDVGLVRSNNQDSGYAGPHLLVVADGMGGHAGGDIASSLAIAELAPLDGESHGADDALTHLSKAIASAHQRLLERVAEEPELAGMGTTVSAILRSGNLLAVAHIGDSRAYLLRDGELTQLTRDHSFVQTLVDQGRLTREEAEHHPRRSVLMRVLSDLVEDAEPDMSMREARPGDRYLLCTDGLSGVVSFDTLQETLAVDAGPASTCDALVQLALRAGAPDNVTCVVADIIEAGPEAGSVPTVVGAAAKRQPPRPPSLGSSAERAAALTAPADPDDESGAARPTAEQRRGRALRRGLGGLLAVVLLAGAGYGGWYWSQRQFYVAPSDGFAAVYRGLSQDLGPVELSRLESVARDVPVRELPTYSRQRVTQGIVAEDRASADQIITTLREQVAACRAARAGHSPETPSPRVGESPTGTKDGTRTPGTTTATTTPTTSPTGTGTAPRTSDPPSPEDCGGIG